MIPDGEPVAAALDQRAYAPPREPDVPIAEGVAVHVITRFAPGVGVAVVAMSPGAEIDHRPRVTEDLFVLRGALHLDEGAAGAGTHLRLASDRPRRITAPDGARVVVAARPAGLDHDLWSPPTPWPVASHGAPGVDQIDLVDDRTMRVVLLRFAPGAAIGRHVHAGGEELFVVEGELEDDHGRYPAESWVRQPPGSHHAVISRPGCVLWTTSGHLVGPARLRLEAAR